MTLKEMLDQQLDSKHLSYRYQFLYFRFKLLRLRRWSLPFPKIIMILLPKIK